MGPAPLEGSLFPADQAVMSDEAIRKILTSKVTLPQDARVALVNFDRSGNWGARVYGRYYWTDEGYLKLQQGYVDAISQSLMADIGVAEVTPLPTLMIPKEATIPALRESAVRLQADMILVFRVNSSIYSQYRAFAKDRVKAFSTCEMLLLDVRTGIVPFTTIQTRESYEKKSDTDYQLSETIRRAEETAANAALRDAAQAVAAFFKEAREG